MWRSIMATKRAPAVAGRFYPNAAHALRAMVAYGRDTSTRVILLGPSHRVPFRGIATSSAEAYATPLGIVPIDADAMDSVAVLPQVQVLDRAHAFEHSLEVQLPFLQMTLADFKLVPL